MAQSYSYSYLGPIGSLDEKISELQALASLIRSKEQPDNESLLSQLDGKIQRMQAVRTTLASDCCGASCSGEFVE